MIRTCLAATIIACLGSAACRAQAPSLGDYLQKGYTVARVTTFQGAFAGCTRKANLVFADGTVFRCDQNVHRRGFNPRVYLLRQGGDPPSVIFIAAETYEGAILQLGQRTLRVPYKIVSSDDGVPGADALPVGGSALIDAIAPVSSINQLQSESQSRLNTAQSQPLEHPASQLTEEGKEDLRDAKQH
jgi:hypothetical protein